MWKRILWIGLIPFLSWAQDVEEPPNLGQLKLLLRSYIDSGSYDADIANVYENVKVYIEAHRQDGPKYAVVMDIDETTLSNMYYEKLYGFGYSGKTWGEWVEQKKATAIPAAKAFYLWGREKGITFFFVTGRGQRGKTFDEDPTVINMKSEGFTDYGKIYLKPKTKGLKTVAYKSGARKEIEAMGFTIIANIGDQLSDLEGGYSMSTWKLPNPMYWVK